MHLRPLPSALPRTALRTPTRVLRPILLHHLETPTLNQLQPHRPQPPTRPASTTSSSTRWLARQTRDPLTRSATLANLKSRAAYKLLEIDAKHRLFARGDTVVDLGYAPGSWSQVAVSKTKPGGRVIGVDVIPAAVSGVSTLQGDFLSEEIREEVRRFVGEAGRANAGAGSNVGGGEGFTEAELEERGRGTVERAGEGQGEGEGEVRDRRAVNVVLSDMMMNTSGMMFRDHAGSMDLCNAALLFAFDTLANGGHFLCKFYQGSEDRALEMQLKKLFEKVHRIKPDSSRKESREAYFLSMRRRGGVTWDEVFGGQG